MLSRSNDQAEHIAEAVFLVIILIMLAGPASGFLMTASTWVSAGLTKSIYQVKSTRDLADKVFESTERIRELEAKLAKSEIELATIKRQARDTNNLRKMLGLRDKLSRKAVAAEVSAREPDNWYEQVILDKGQADGVVKGSAVVTADGVVGQVFSTTEHASVVRLITDPEQKLGVVIKRIGLPGIISGNGPNLAIIDYVPVGTNVDVGDKIICYGKGGAFPDNHPVGEVASIRRDTNGASMQIDVKLAENCFDLDQVLVLPPI